MSRTSLFKQIIRAYCTVFEIRDRSLLIRLYKGTEIWVMSSFNKSDFLSCWDVSRRHDVLLVRHNHTHNCKISVFIRFIISLRKSNSSYLSLLSDLLRFSTTIYKSQPNRRSWYPFILAPSLFQDKNNNLTVYRHSSVRRTNRHMTLHRRRELIYLWFIYRCKYSRIYCNEF
jgi:hypothetical protein